MDFDLEKKPLPPKPSPIKDVNGFIEKGEQFDIEITLPEDKRDVIYGIIKDTWKDPIANAVVKLIEIEYKMGKEERKPVSHTFTNDDGEFVFGPLCPDKEYAIQIWKNEVKHCKICAICNHDGDCLKGEKLNKCDKKDRFVDTNE